MRAIRRHIRHIQPCTCPDYTKQRWPCLRATWRGHWMTLDMRHHGKCGLDPVPLNPYTWDLEDSQDDQSDDPQGDSVP